MKLHVVTCLAGAALCLTLGACAKKTAATTPPAPTVAPTAPAPTRAATPAPAAAEQPRQVAKEASRMPDAATKLQIQDLLNKIQDAYFDFARHTLRPDAETALRANAKTLSEIIQQYPDFRLTVEGYCDERGSDEFNMALGDARAKQAKDYLVSLGLPGAQLKTVSYGKEKPVCTEHDENCWQKNRRAHVTQAQ
ncbi:OmpA family protein [uncultured Paludibaculum sp.]|uniref:OmpA family protein n=1 Tax=uncultured Paludibaculum sp. TaxID=1765020 RepID=UPI002AAA71AF|nr:OmpA family protein [uncultured Paludibaculum sp.]